MVLIFRLLFAYPVVGGRAFGKVEEQEFGKGVEFCQSVNIFETFFNSPLQGYGDSVIILYEYADALP